MPDTGIGGLWGTSGARGGEAARWAVMVVMMGFLSGIYAGGNAGERGEQAP